MTFQELELKIREYQDGGKKMFTTSSFQTHSLVMLHMLSRIDKSIPVYFINTGYLFPDTIAFKDQVTQEFGIKVLDIKSSVPRNMQVGTDGKLLFTSDPDYCCYLNKTQPTDALLQEYDIWINGVRADQSATRAAMKVEQPAPHNTFRFHPMLDWNAKMIFQYIREHNLPRHPMDAKGYMSIGCEPCTRKLDAEMQEREARWFGMKKTECGLHTDLISK